MTERLHSRGGTTRSLAEAQALMEDRKPTRGAVLESAIWRVLQAKGTFTADDLRDVDVDIPAGTENMIGPKVGSFARRGWIRRIGWQRSEAEARHGGENKLYELTEKGRAELRRLARGDAGVGVGVPRPQGADGLLPTRDCANTDPGVPPAANNQAPEGAQDGGPAGGNAKDAPAGQLPLPLVDVPQGEPRKATHRDADDPELEAA